MNPIVLQSSSKDETEEDATVLESSFEYRGKLWSYGEPV